MTSNFYEQKFYLNGDRSPDCHGKLFENDAVAEHILKSDNRSFLKGCEAGEISKTCNKSRKSCREIDFVKEFLKYLWQLYNTFTKFCKRRVIA